MPSEENCANTLIWEREMIEKLMASNLKQKRLRRRLGLALKLFLLTCYLYLFLTIFIFPSAKKNTRIPHVGVINIYGPISPTGINSANNIIASLKQAFQNKNTQAIVLRIDGAESYGLVQTARIASEIHYLHSQYPNKKIYTVCDGDCLQNHYSIAAATDAIYANRNSRIGSIGSIAISLFGFVDLLKKMGIERRLITSGPNKSFLDPFSPLKPEDIKRTKEFLNTIHQNCIQSVKQSRGAHLKANSDVFSGSSWLGEQALALGLIDGLGSFDTLTHSVIKNNNVVDFTIRPPLINRILK